MRWAALLICLGFPAVAQSPEALAGHAIAQLAAAQSQLTNAQSKGDRVRALTETVGAYEDGLAALRAGLRQVATEQTVLNADLDAQRETLGRFLAALQSIARTPTPVVQSHPDGALAAARAGGVIADMTPELREKVTGLRAQLARLDGLEDLRRDGLRILQDGLDGAQQARASLGQAISDRTDLPTRFEDDPVQTAILLASADTLDAFANGLLGAIPPNNVVLTPAGNLPLPVAGYVLPDRRAGQNGVLIAAADQALVTTPVAATLMFQGDFLEYGKVVILEPAAGVLFVIAGLSDTFGLTGQILPVGTPIGLVGGVTVNDDGKLSENLDTDTTAEQKTVYLEVREGQSPVNPDAWFALE